MVVDEITKSRKRFRGAFLVPARWHLVLEFESTQAHLEPCEAVCVNCARQRTTRRAADERRRRGGAQHGRECGAQLLEQLASGRLTHDVARRRSAANGAPG